VPLADPFVYNGPSPIAIPVQAQAPDGTPLEVPLNATSEASDVAVVVDQSVRCLRAGDARIAVTAGAARAVFVLQCRPILSFGPPLQAMDAVLGGPPVPFAPVAFDSSGRAVTDLRFSATSEDTSVIAIASGLAVPRALGSARVRLDFGGIETFTTVEVVAPLVRERIRLARGEYRSWALGPGRYVATLAHTNGNAAPRVAWRSANANCSFDTWSRATLHCVVADSGAVVAIAQAASEVSVRIDRRAR
jgi:hypothetical protein